MLRLLMRDGEVFEGYTHLDVVSAMKGATMFSDVNGVLDYIAAVHERVEDVEGVELILGGEKIDERCEAFLLELDRTGLAKLETARSLDLDLTVRMIRKVAEVLNAGDLAGCWTFLRDRLRVTEDQRDEIERRLGLGGPKTETETDHVQG